MRFWVNLCDTPEIEVDTESDVMPLMIKDNDYQLTLFLCFLQVFLQKRLVLFDVQSVVTPDSDKLLSGFLAMFYRTLNNYYSHLL